METDRAGSPTCSRRIWSAAAVYFGQCVAAAMPSLVAVPLPLDPREVEWDRDRRWARWQSYTSTPTPSPLTPSRQQPYPGSHQTENNLRGISCTCQHLSATTKQSRMRGRTRSSSTAAVEARVLATSEVVPVDRAERAPSRRISNYQYSRARAHNTFFKMDLLCVRGSRGMNSMNTHESRHSTLDSSRQRRHTDTARNRVRAFERTKATEAAESSGWVR